MSAEKNLITYSNSALVARIGCKWWLEGKSLKSADVDACWKDPPHNKNEKKFMKGALTHWLSKWRAYSQPHSFTTNFLPYQIMKGFSKWFLGKSVDFPRCLHKRNHLDIMYVFGYPPTYRHFLSDLPTPIVKWSFIWPLTTKQN